jgi:hypothetical protein
MPEAAAARHGVDGFIEGAASDAHEAERQAAAIADCNMLRSGRPLSTRFILTIEI